MDVIAIVDSVAAKWIQINKNKSINDQPQHRPIFFDSCF